MLWLMCRLLTLLQLLIIMMSLPQPTGIRLPLHYKESLEMLFAPPTAEAIPVSALPLTANDDKKNLAMSLWAEGLVRVTTN